MRVMVSGGHLTPALALVDYAVGKGDKVLVVGRRYASKNSLVKSREKAEVERLGSDFSFISSVKIDRNQKLVSILKLPVLIWGVVQAIFKIVRFRPNVVVSFGGYVAVPIVIAAKLMGIYVITHEQTRAVGLANQFISYLADRVAVSFKESKKYFDLKKTVVTGNLLRKETLVKNNRKPNFVKVANKSMLYITGGNQGSKIINDTVGSVLDKLVKNYSVIHQCGDSKIYNYFNKLSSIRESLEENLRESYVVKKWFDASEISWILRHSKIIISRSGANTVNEIMASGCVAIFVPLSNSYKKEQLLNAQFLVDKKAAMIINQNDLSRSTLLDSISEIAKKYKAYKENAKKISEKVEKNGVKKLYKLAYEYKKSEKKKKKKKANI